jgi:hypothetical protein
MGKTVSDVVADVDEFAKLHAIKAKWDKVEPRYRELQKQFRQVAGDRTLELPGSNGAIVLVEQRPDSVCRKIEPEDFPFVIKWSGEHLLDGGPDQPGLFSLHPSAGGERSFDLNVLRLRPKNHAANLIARLKRATTAFVRLFHS